MTTMRFALTAAALLCAAPLAQSQTVLKTWYGFGGSRLGSSASEFYDYDNDGFQDVLVGAPGATASHGYGVVYLMSGQALMQQNNYTILATLIGNSTSDQFGASIETIGDITGDGKPEFVVAATLDDLAANNAGRVFLYNGASLALLADWSGTGAQSRFGWSMTHLGDWDQDGNQEIAVGAPFDALGGSNRGVVKVLEITPLLGGFAFSNVLSFQGAADLDLRGYALDSADFGVIGGFAGRRELILGQPLVASPLGGTSNGVVFVYAYRGNWTSLDFVVRQYGASGDEYGFSLDAGADTTGDGVPDLVVGAPYHDYLGGLGHDNGFIHVWDGASIANHQWVSAMGTVWGEDDAHLGWSVRAIPDLNGDGRGEALVGFPTGHPAAPDWGAAAVFSGETGFFLSRVDGLAHDSLGEVVGPAIDLDGNGKREVILCGPSSDNMATDAGVLRVVSLHPVLPAVYCGSKPNSLGCSPTIGSTGTPSASGGSFHVITTQLRNNKPALGLYAYQYSGALFQGGTLCLASPIKRLAGRNAGGSPAGNDCTGTTDYEFNGMIQSGSDPLLVVGQEVFCQTWARDPQDAFFSSLSNGLRFVIEP